MISVKQNNDLYEIRFRYDPFMVDLVKGVPGRRWNPEGKFWTIPSDKLGWFMNAVKGTVYEGSLQIESDEDINVNADIDVTHEIPEVDLSDVEFKVKEGSDPYPHQLDFMKFALDRQRRGNKHGFLIADEQGCISGDAIISLNFRKAHSKITLAELYDHWVLRPQYHSDGSYKVRCLKDGKFGLHTIKGVVQSGVKSVYLLELTGGYSIKLTHDHPVLTDAGYKPISELTVGDTVYTNGDIICKACGSTSDIVTYKYSKHIGYCRKCMYKRRDAEHSAKYIEHVDSDGYVVCRGTSIDIDKHGQPNKSGFYYKHRLIMETKLGRQLLDTEVVHHIDGDRSNNSIDNLELTTIWDHHRVQHDESYKLIGEDYISRWGNSVVVVPKAQEVVSIQYVGEEMTYDIKMDDPYHNFIANGIVVHNCGKSVESMNLAMHNKATLGHKHCLVICCINGSKFNWQREIEEQTKGEEKPYILGTRIKRDGTLKLDTGSASKCEDLSVWKQFGKEDGPDLPYFLILNIEALRYKVGKAYMIADAIIERIKLGDINTIIIDEIHKNASPSAMQGKQLLRIKKVTQAQAMWLPMSGTPITKKPTDAFVPLKLVDGHGFTSFYKWCQEFCIYGGYGGYEIVGYKNIPKLKRMLEHNMIRRLKADVIKDMPPKIRYTEYVVNTSYQEKLYKVVAQQIRDNKFEILQNLNPMTQFLRLRQVNGSPELVDDELKIDFTNPKSMSTYLTKNAKLQRLMELLEEIHERGEKVLIFSNWVEPLRTLYKYISAKYKVCCYTGTMDPVERDKHKKIFQENPEYTVMIGTIGAMGTTHTLTAATNVIFFDEPWNPSDKEQAEDRCHRIGTHCPVNIYTLITKDTIDERVSDILYTKSGISKYIVDNKLDIKKNPELFDLLLGSKKGGK